MAKAKSAFVCTECGAHSVKWAGQCPDCASWNTLSRIAITPSRDSALPGAAPSTIESLPDDLGHRDLTGFDEFDRVLRGGLVPGAVVLLGGDPGVGKSTLLQQISSRLATELPVFYVTGEESLRQIGQRSHRLGLKSSGMQLLADTSIDNVLEQAASNAARCSLLTRSRQW